MSEKPVWMEYDGLGTAKSQGDNWHHQWSENQAHCRGYPLVESLIASDPVRVKEEYGKELPYIATLLGGLCISADIVNNDKTLLSAVKGFLGENWEDYEVAVEDVNCFQNCALICNPYIAHRTLLRRTHQYAIDNCLYTKPEEGELVGDPNPPVIYLEKHNGKPKLALMMTKAYDTTPIRSGEGVFCAKASVEIRLSDAITDGYCVQRSLCYFIPRPDDTAYQYCAGCRMWDATNKPSGNSEYLGGWVIDGVSQSGDGISDTYYATLGQMLIGRSIDGMGYATGVPFPDWGLYSNQGEYVAPAMYLGGGDFEAYCTLLKKTGPTFSYGDTDSFYCKFIYPEVSAEEMPGVYKCLGDGKIYKVVTGSITKEHVEDTPYGYASTPDSMTASEYNLIKEQGNYYYARTVRYFEDAHFFPNQYGGADALSVTISVSWNDVSPPGALTSYKQWVVINGPENGVTGVKVGDGSGDKNFGVQDVVIYHEAGTVNILVDLLYCRENDIRTIPIHLLYEYSDGSGYPKNVYDIALGDMPDDLVWEPFKAMGSTEILPPYKF